MIVNDHFRAERKASRLSDAGINAKEEVSSQPIGANGKMNMKNVLNWNEGNVRNFLVKNKLISMLSLCDGINGEELAMLYIMCKANPASMYRSLKFELLHGYNRILPIS